VRLVSKLKVLAQQPEEQKEERRAKAMKGIKTKA